MGAADDTPTDPRPHPAGRNLEPINLAAQAPIRLGALTIAPALRQVVHDDGREQIIEPRQMQVLVALLRAHGEILTRDDLLASCWGGVVVGEDAVTRAISSLRRLSEGIGAGVFKLETITKVGFRLVVGDAKAETGPSPSDQTRTPPAPLLAVLAFDNLSGDPDQEYFADGMVREIVEALSRCRSFLVIASSSSLSLKGKGLSAEEAARRLGVRYVLEGSVRRAAGRVRIGVQLIEAGEAAPIWTHRFEESLDDIFDLQDKVAVAVAGRIEPTVEAAEIRRATGRPTESLSSYDLYLQAMLPGFSTLSKDEYLRALGLLERAIALDPNYGRALAVAANHYSFSYTFRYSDDPEGDLRRCYELALRAVRVAGDDADVLSLVGGIYARLGADQTRGIAMIDKALTLNPGSARTWLISSLVRGTVGQADLSAEHAEIAMRLDPMGRSRGLQVSSLGRGRFQQRRFAEAVGLLREAVELGLNPANHAYLAASLGHLGRSEAARAELARYRALTSRPPGDAVRDFITDPADLKLMLEGIALAEGPPDSDPGAGAEAPLGPT